MTFADISVPIIGQSSTVQLAASQHGNANSQAVDYQQMEDRIFPDAPVVHRNALTAVDSPTEPATLGSGLWAANPGGRINCRVFISTGGTAKPTTYSTRPYLRSGGATGVMAGAAAVLTQGTDAAIDSYYDVAVRGDDIFVALEVLTGGTAPTVTVKLVWS